MKKKKWIIVFLVLLFFIMFYRLKGFTMEYCIKNNSLLGVKILSFIISPDERCMYFPSQPIKSKKREFFFKLVSYVLGEDMIEPKRKRKRRKNISYHRYLDVLRPFEYAFIENNYDILKYFISQNPDVINKCYDEFSYNLLQRCTKLHNLKMLKFLLKHGGNIMIVRKCDNEKLDLIDYSALCFKNSKLSDVIAMIDYLENNGLKKKEINIDFIKNTETEKDFEFVDYMFKKYLVKWENRDKRKYEIIYFLEQALAYNKIYILEYFLEIGLDINLVEDKSDSIAQMAVNYKREKFLSEIIENVDLGYKNSDDETVLQTAKRLNSDKCIEIIEEEMERRGKMDLKH